MLFFPLQLSQPAVSVEGQVSNPPSTSSTEVNSQTIPEKQPSQEVKMEVKMDVDQPEPADAQPDDTKEVRLCYERRFVGIPNEESRYISDGHGLIPRSMSVK